MRIVYDIPTYDKHYKHKVSDNKTTKEFETENLEDIIKLINNPEVKWIMIYKKWY